MDKEKVLNLAKLSRISISEKEAQNLSHEFESILKYVGEIKKAEATGTEINEDFPVKNVMREDEILNTSGAFSEAIFENAPSRKENYVKVKNIL